MWFVLLCVPCLGARRIALANGSSDPRLSLVRAAQDGDLAQVRELLVAHDDRQRRWLPFRRGFLDARDERGRTALQAAAEGNHTAVVRSLLEHRARTDLHDGINMLPLYAASIRGHAAIVELLAAGRANVGARSVGYDTALAVAARVGYVDVARHLLQHGADVEQEAAYKRTPAILAAQHGHLDMLTLMARHGADMNRQDSFGGTVLGAVALNYPMLRLALDHGAREREVGRQPRIFELCVVAGCEPCVEAFCAHNASLRPSDLGLAILEGHTSIVRILLNHGLDVNFRHSDGNTPLHIAAWDGHADIIELLLRRRADISALNNDSQTALDLAIDRNSSVQSLLVPMDDLFQMATSVSTPCAEPCDEELDPVLHEPFAGRVVIRSPLLSGGKKCYTVHSLLEWLATRQTDPLSNKQYTLSQLRLDLTSSHADGSPYACVAVATP